MATGSRFDGRPLSCPSTDGHAAVLGLRRARYRDRFWRRRHVRRGCGVVGAARVLWTCREGGRGSGGAGHTEWRGRAHGRRAERREPRARARRPRGAIGGVTRASRGRASAPRRRRGAAPARPRARARASATRRVPRARAARRPRPWRRCCTRGEGGGRRVRAHRDRGRQERASRSTTSASSCERSRGGPPRSRTRRHWTRDSGGGDDDDDGPEAARERRRAGRRNRRCPSSTRGSGNDRGRRARR